MYVNSTLFANLELLRVQVGKHPKAGSNPQVIKAASEGINSAIEYNVNKASSLGRLQFWFFILGALSYTTWQILEMYVLAI